MFLIYHVGSSDIHGLFYSFSIVLPMQLHAVYRKPVGIKEHNSKNKMTNINLPVTSSQT